jgi:hypothetical protein
MITSLIGPNGRLGNQMFQYAALIGIATKQGHEYGINYRRGDSRTWKEFPIDNTFSLMTIDKPFNLTTKHTEILYPTIMEEHHLFEFQERFFKTGDNINLHGFFQTQKYFDHCQDIIRKEFTFKSEIVIEAQQFLANKKDREVVAIHVRRGDYLQATWHGACDIRYYEQAITSQFSDKKYNFAIITDDIPWAQKNLTRGDNYFVCDTQNQFVDLCVMTLCDHNVIANSSYSWWGSWLNRTQGKKVVAPKAWFNPAQHLASLNTKDLYQPDWIVI